MWGSDLPDGEHRIYMAGRVEEAAPVVEDYLVSSCHRAQGMCMPAMQTKQLSTHNFFISTRNYVKQLVRWGTF